jgi:cytoskeleton protein RodZ
MNLGEVLHNARTSVGISLEDLAASTSIRAGLLGEMEKNNFSHCGGDIYARGHLRNIAPKIGLDPIYLIELYNEEHSAESRSINELLVENNVARVPHERKRISWKVPAAFSIAIVVVLAVVQIVISNVNSDTPKEIAPTQSATPTASAAPEAIASATATTSPSPSQSPTPSQSPSKSPSKSPTPAASGVKMTITASRGNSRIDIVVDGKHVDKGSIFQGESKSFEAKTSIAVYFSNPAGLDVSVNGELLAPLGGENQEVRRTFR